VRTFSAHSGMDIHASRTVRSSDRNWDRGTADKGEDPTPLRIRLMHASPRPVGIVVYAAPNRTIWSSARSALSGRWLGHADRTDVGSFAGVDPEGDDARGLYPVEPDSAAGILFPAARRRSLASTR